MSNTQTNMVKTTGYVALVAITGTTKLVQHQRITSPNSFQYLEPVDFIYILSTGTQMSNESHFLDKDDRVPG